MINPAPLVGVPSSDDFVRGNRKNAVKNQLSFVRNSANRVPSEPLGDSPKPRTDRTQFNDLIKFTGSTLLFPEHPQKRSHSDEEIEPHPKKLKRTRVLYFDEHEVEGKETFKNSFICRDCGFIFQEDEKPEKGYVVVSCPVFQANRLKRIPVLIGDDPIYPDLPQIFVNNEGYRKSYGQNCFCKVCVRARERKFQYLVIQKQSREYELQILLLKNNEARLKENIRTLESENEELASSNDENIKKTRILELELSEKEVIIVDMKKEIEFLKSEMDSSSKELIDLKGRYIQLKMLQDKNLVELNSKIKENDRLNNLVEKIGTLDFFFQNVTGPKLRRMITYMANRIIFEERETIESFYSVRNGSNGKSDSELADFGKYDAEDGRGKRQKWFKYNMEDLSSLDLEKEWNRKKTTYKSLLNEIERIKLSRYTGKYEQKLRTKTKNVTIKHSNLSSLHKLINHRHLAPFRMMTTIFANKNAKRGNNGKILDMGESSGWTHCAATLKLFKLRCLLLIRRKNRNVVRKIKKICKKDPQLIEVLYHYADNSQIIAHASRHTLMSLITPSIYIGNVRCMNPNVTYQQFLTDYRRSKNVHEVTFHDVYEKHFEKDTNAKNVLLDQLFPSVRSDMIAIGTIFQELLSEFEGSSIVEVVKNQYLKTKQKTCENCDFVVSTERNLISKCPNCKGGTLSSLSKEKKAFVYLKASMKAILLEKYGDGEVDKNLWDVPMTGYEDPYLKNVKMEMFKGIPGNPSKLTGAKKMKDNIRSDRKDRMNEVGFIGMDASPHLLLTNDQIQHPDENKDEEYRGDVMHTHMEFQEHIVTKVRSICPETLDIIGYYTEGLKEKINGNGDNHWTIDFCSALFVALYIKLISIFEEHYGVKLENGEVFLEYKKKAEDDDLCPMGIDLFDECSEYIFSHISSRRGDTAGVNSSIRLFIIRLFSGFFPFYQKCLTKDLLVMERLVGDAKKVYDAQMLFPTKNQIPGHCFQSTGACVEEYNFDLEELLPRDPTYDDWNEATEMFEPYNKVLKNAEEWFLCRRIGYFTKPGLHLDVVCMLAALEINDVMFISHCSTQDSDKTFTEIPIKEKRKKILIPRFKSFVEKMKNAYKDRKKISCRKQDCYPIRYDGEIEYENELPFVYDGEESEEQLKKKKKEEPVLQMGNITFHDDRKKESLLSGPQSHKLESKIIEKGQIKCCSKKCKKHIKSVFGALRCEICGGYCFEGTCSKLVWIDMNGKKVLHLAVCNSCGEKKKCCCCRGKIIKDNPPLDDEDDFDKCMRCRRYSHGGCLQEIDDPSMKIKEFICKSCLRRHEQRIKKVRGERGMDKSEE